MIDETIMRPLHNTYSLKNTLKIDIFKIQIMERSIAECLDFEEFVGRSDAVYKSTRGATTDQKLKRKVLCIGLIIRAHRHAAGARSRQENEGLGRSCGGFSSKIHAKVDALGMNLAIIITEGQWHDSVQASNLVEPYS